MKKLLLVVVLALASMMTMAQSFGGYNAKMTGFGLLAGDQIWSSRFFVDNYSNEKPFQEYHHDMASPMMGLEYWRCNVDDGFGFGWHLRLLFGKEKYSVQFADIPHPIQKSLSYFQYSLGVEVGYNQDALRLFAGLDLGTYSASGSTSKFPLLYGGTSASISAVPSLNARYSIGEHFYVSGGLAYSYRLAGMMSDYGVMIIDGESFTGCQEGLTNDISLMVGIGYIR